MKVYFTSDNRKVTCLILLTVAVVAALMGGCRRRPPNTGGGIHGHVVVLMRSKEGANVQGGLSRIELPGAKVTARDVTSGTITPAVMTNAHGYFQLPRLAPGTYQVCAEASGFNPGCLAKNVTVTSFSVVLSEDVQLQAKQSAIAGTVLLGTKSRVPCFTDRPAFRTFVAAKVTLEDVNHNQVAGPVDGNGLGQYVLTAVPAPGQYQVVAKCEGAEGRAPLTVSQGETFQDVIISNSPPSVLHVEASIANKPVRVGVPGSTMSLHAVTQDPDADPLAFKWVDSNGTVIAGTSDTVQLTLPPNQSSTTVFVQAGDGHGGFGYSLIPVTGTTLKDAIFTGSVVDANSGAPISGADVTVNGKAIQTDPTGAFAITVDIDVRYTVSVRKQGYALLSKVTYSPAADLRLALEQVAPEAFNIGEGGRIVPKDTRKQNRPVTLVVPPNSLVDKNGNPAAGQGRAYLWGYPQGTPIPGDMSAIFKGRPARMETFGAMDVQLTDLGGQPLQVRSGATLELVMSAAGNPNPPATIPLFHFDEAKGLWQEDGQWTLSGNDYHATVTHLTAFNADLAFGTTGCIEYHVDIENSPALPFYLHIEQNGQTANHEPFQVNDFAGVVSRLRPATPTDWWALPSPTSAKADAIGHGTVLSSNFTSNPNDPNGDFPGVGARDSNNNPVCTVFDVNASFPPHETFLVGLPVNPNPGVNPTEEGEYATAVDAWAGAGSRANFTDFKNTNGFPASEATVVYFNNGDLKLGRDMHCRQTASNRIACYVSNYLDKAQPPAGAAPALLAAANAHLNNATNLLFATVAMEWDPNPNPTNVDTSVQFFVYNGAGARVNEATLDGEGPKSVPQICVACHGGTYDPNDNLAHEARFLPFDIASFRFVDDPGVFGVAGAHAFGFDSLTRENQLGQFRALNALIVQTEANRTALPHNAVTELINGWYQGCGGVNNGACGTCLGGAGCPDSFRSNFRPGPWDTNANDQSLYDNVVRPECRGCHIMRPSFDWSDVSQFTGPFKSTIERYVCTGQAQPGNQRRMSHAEVPFKTFWQSTLAPGLLKQPPMSLAQCERQ